jgi:hypothetical protein
MPRKMSPDAHRSNPAYDTRARAHESFSWGAGLRVRRRRTATRGENRRVSSSPPKAAAQPLTWGPGPMNHASWASVSECEEGEPPREEHVVARGGVPLHLRRNQLPSLWHGGLGPRVILLGHWFLGIEKSNRCSRQYCAPSGLSQKTEKVKFLNQGSGIEAPRAWPSETIKHGGHGSSQPRGQTWQLV